MTGERGATCDYLPIYALPYWGTIGEFVRAAVAEASAGSDRDKTSLYVATTPLVLWCWQTRGLPLERGRIFRAAVIEEFIHRGMPDHLQSSRATIRSSLWRALEVLDPAEAARTRRAIPRSKPTEPYTTQDVASLHSWAATQRTERRRSDALALLSLGFGAGLATRELLEVTVGDIDVTAAGVSVSVWASRPRVVPVLPEWHRPIQRLLVERRGDQGWLFRPGREGTDPGQVTDFVLRARTTLDIRPSRMRTTWLVRHLELGTSPSRLLQMSGLRNLAALDKVTHFVPSSGVTNPHHPAERSA